MKNNRAKRATIAQETLALIEQGFYTNSQSELVHIKKFTEKSLEHTIHYKPEDFDAKFEEEINQLIKIQEEAGIHTTFEVVNMTTLASASQNIATGKKVVCLNFASAKNPGGGFLGGSQAQEESLARASDLSVSLTSKMEMYEFHRGRQDCLYSDNMIFSPQTTVFRDDNDTLLDVPYHVSFITSPAVNAGCVRQKYTKQKSKIESTMIRRTERVLSLALKHQADVLILGAWGCGVFQNAPEEVASYFAQFLQQGGRFVNVFPKIVFAVLDNSKDGRFMTPFQKYFG